MSDFYNEFTNISQEKWLEKVSKDLKGKNIEDILHHTHPIEDVEYTSYAFSNNEQSHELPGVAPYTRGGKFDNNDWHIINALKNTDAKTLNKVALERLMSGATGLRIDLADFHEEDMNNLVKEIGFEFIVSNFTYHNKEQFEWLTRLTAVFNKTIGTAINASKENFGFIPNMRNRLVDGTKVQATGGNVTQEITYCLHEGHNTLYKLIENEGLSVDEAAAEIKFKFGIGGNYFFEISKIKAFRTLWYNIVNAYSPAHSCSTIPYIEGETGFLNKSLNDPHNNLLRQTTEALSAVIGGVDELTILPYNWKAKNPDISKTQRLATNIALLLKEESYLDKVVDPAGGSYSQEKLIESLRKNAWKMFLKIEKEGLIPLKTNIQESAKKRTKMVEDKRTTLIGVNKYLNTESHNETWDVIEENEFGKSLILELECNITEA